MRDENYIVYTECFVANIIGNHYWGEEKVIRSGTKQFSAGTKVYCAFIYGGNGHESVIVLGKPRKSFRMVEVTLRTYYLKNLRIQNVYKPRVINFINKYSCIESFGFEGIKDMIERVNNSHREITPFS
jgi:hypothetical protein